jgi:predicted short-subunit dehydrogenase-like oxidoreductase (DUF2520 family)
MTERVFILGAGRAGLGLARALRASGVEVIGVHGRRNVGGPDAVSTGRLPNVVREATVVLVTVRDAQIDTALRELRDAPLAPNSVVLHASGSAEPLELAVLRAAGHPAGTFHPLVPLADPDRAPELLRGSWIGVDGDARARTCARALATALGAHTLEIPAGRKGRYHAAAVLASNFPAVLLALGERLLADAGLDREVARRALYSLFRAAADNLGAGSGARMLTGPIVRGDVDTVRLNLEALRSEPDVLAVYRVLSLAAIDLARQGGTDEARLREIEHLLRRAGESTI